MATLALSGVASATLLTFYGQIVGTFSVSQSVVMDGGQQSVSEVMSGALGGETFCFNHTVQNFASVPAKISLTYTNNTNIDGVSVNYLNGNQLTYWTEDTNFGFNRSTTPFDFTVGTDNIMQGLNQDGSMYLQSHTTDATYYDIGFYKVYGTLGNLTSVPMVSSGSTVSANLWFDKNNNGEFFAWSNNKLTGLDGDMYANVGSGSSITINDASVATWLTGGQTCTGIAGPYPTIAELKAGKCTGIDSNTPIAIWVGYNVLANSTQSANVTSFNGSPFTVTSPMTLQPGQKLSFESCYSFDMLIAPGTYNITTTVAPS